MAENDVSEARAAAELFVTPPCVHGWKNGVIPKPHHRAAIATWTKGYVAEDDWETAEESSARRRVRPHRAGEAA